LTSRLSRFDRRVARCRGVSELVGVDEAGRGCLAGPVVVAAVRISAGEDINGVDDSKQLAAAARETAFQAIRGRLQWRAMAVSAAEVDRRDVLHASLWGMEQVVQRLPGPSELVLVDGPFVPDGLRGRSMPVVAGDRRSLCIAAASVVAKVLRDRLMRVWHRRYPDYGFDRHVGYPTPEHMVQLRRSGPCPLHRRSFAPVRAVASQLPLPFFDLSETSDPASSEQASP